MPETLSHVHPTLPTIQRKSNGKATGRAEMLPCTDGQYDFAKENVMARLDAYPFV